ncbi:MAG: FHA domain-containing protein [Acinetobacter populi]|jgi:pSer/pThr/pTyr-binding forkhead associated (FHA) protein|uniref:FHA domain-containing protein n=1 Tax=Acinetobacter populi TaxID=1582270 RepID=UPI0023539B92|nr:FHA domain-containing protein [Acinetobacter populi]MCH4248125.1 FHA domain-containing protein [Acinetobacter populi]
MRWKLVGLSEPIVGETLVIDRDMVIGRHQQADIVLQAAHVSRRHAALLLKEDGSLWIQDLGSSNGTFVNNQQVTEQQLHSQDEINFENIRFQIIEDQVEQAATTDAPSIEKVVPGDQGMPTLEQRGADVALNRDGMPTNIGVPKPAPIPEHVEVNVEPEPQPVAIPELESRVEQVEQQKKNAKVGVISLVILIILLILVSLFFVGH